MQSLKQFDEVRHSEDDNYFVFDNWQWTKWLLLEGFEHITNETEDSYGFLQYNPDERYNSFFTKQLLVLV